VKKRLCIVVVSVAALFGIGSGLAPAKAETSAVPTSVNVSAPACLRLYALNLGTCPHLR